MTLIDKGNESKKKILDFINYYQLDYKDIMFSFSGGKDSSVVYHLLKEIGIVDKINVVFVDTRMEFETIYDFVKTFDNVQVIYPKTAQPLVYLKYGLPIHSKYTSEMLSRLQKHKFDFINDTYKDFDELNKKYPNCKIALQGLCHKNIKMNCPEGLKKQLKDITFKVSNKCCDELKKKPTKRYIKENNIKLQILGIRKDEGGIRANKYTRCIVHSLNLTKYFPLGLFSNSDIDNIIQEKNIKICDAYTVYKQKRTGCVGCPFSKEGKNELETLKKYEPNKYNYCTKTYNKVYEIQDRK